MGHELPELFAITIHYVGKRHMRGHKITLPDDIDAELIVANDDRLSVRVTAKNFKAEDALAALVTEEQLVNLCNIINSTDSNDDGAIVCLQHKFTLTPDSPTKLIPIPQGVWYAVCFVKHADFTLQTVVSNIDEQLREPEPPSGSN